MFQLNFDGSLRKQDITYGYVIIDENGKEILSKGGKIPITRVSSNFAEYISLQFGLIEAAKLGIKRIKIVGDSLLVVNQLKGIYKIKSPHLKYMAVVIKEMLKSFEYYELEWVSRDQNTKADRAGRIS